MGVDIAVEQALQFLVHESPKKDVSIIGIQYIEALHGGAFLDFVLLLCKRLDRSIDVVIHNTPDVQATDSMKQLSRKIQETMEQPFPSGVTRRVVLVVGWTIGLQPLQANMALSTAWNTLLMEQKMHVHSKINKFVVLHSHHADTYASVPPEHATCLRQLYSSSIPECACLFLGVNAKTQQFVW